LLVFQDLSNDRLLFGLRALGVQLCHALKRNIVRSRWNYYDVVLGDLQHESAVINTKEGLLLRPIFVENEGGEREILCYVPQSLDVFEDELFTQMVCDLLRAGMQEAFPIGGAPVLSNRLSLA
jgi:hypothetical protein